MKRLILPLLCLVALLFGGCATPVKKDYTEFRRHQPRSILVLPPINETTDINAGYSVLTTATAPLAELGYYVLPVALVDRFMKENGMPSAAEMHQAPLQKLQEVFGADAVLYITVTKYGSKYVVISSNTSVHLKARLVDCHTGTLLWEHHIEFEQAGQGGLIEALVEQVMNKLLDQAHGVAGFATTMLLIPPDQGLLRGPLHPEYGKESASK